MSFLTQLIARLHRCCALLLVVIASSLSALDASAATFTVTSNLDAGPGTLRQAIIDAAANGDGPFDDIRFAIAGPGPHTITLTSELPPVSTRVAIQGYTQPGARANTLDLGNDAVIRIRLDGGNTLGVGLTLAGHSISVSGLAITRFTNAGIALPGASSVNNYVQGNYIGLEPGGSPAGNGTGVAFGNAGGGPADISIGGNGPSGRNVISGNAGDGISLLNDATRNQIVGNYIGTNPAGTSAIPNGTGIRLHGSAGSPSGGNSIGGGLRSLGNVISGNLGDGIVLLRAQTTTVANNIIGPTADGQWVLYTSGGVPASQRNGISIGEAGSGHPVTGHTIFRNLIRSNRLDGVRVTAGTGVRIKENDIFWNGGLDIDLNGDIVTANDVGDSDTGPNGLQNFPVITSVASIGLTATRVSGTLDSTPNSTFRIELFSNRVCDDTEHGGGEVFSEPVDVTTGSDGRAAFTVQMNRPSTAHNLVTATATSASGDTSEFSSCFFVQSFLVEVSGIVTRNGAPLAGVSVTLGGNSYGTKVTAADGRYVFGSLPAGGTYTLTPSLGGHTFSSTTTTITPVVNATVNFAATRLLQITGRALDLNGTPLPGVRIALSGGQTGATTTDGDGRYTFGTLAPGGAYAIKATLPGFTFAPEHRAFDNVQDDLSGEATGFTATIGAYRRYFAEGATGFFDTTFALLNPTGSSANVLLRFQKGDGTVITHPLTMIAGSRATIEPKTIAGLASAEFSTVVESNVPVVADRTMRWGATGYGSHAETSIAEPSLKWYLAEGATLGGFNLFYLLQNPSSSAAEVKITYLRPAPAAPLERSYVVAANSRFNVWVNVEDPTLAAAEVSAVIDVRNGVPIIVERAMYRDGAGEVFRSGHASAGIPSPSNTWFLAEGATGEYFDLFVLIANPGSADAQVVATYLLPDGTRLTKSYVVPARSRFNIWVDEEELPSRSGKRPLSNTAVSTTITSTNGVPIIVERSMWWPGSAATWHEGHNSAGATVSGTRWAMADGDVGGEAEVQTYILIANTSAIAGLVRVTLYFEDGTSADRTFTIAPTSRFNVDVSMQFPTAKGRRFGAVVESLGVSPAQIVVERAMYSNAGGVVWAAGTDALATRLQ